MFNLPDNAPWWALVAVAVLTVILCCGVRVVRHVWPQNSRDRRALLEEWQRGRRQRRREIDPGDEPGA
ncbi:hypothetical protein ACFU6O_03740 [Streptomyces albidoflavus]